MQLVDKLKKQTCSHKLLVKYWTNWKKVWAEKELKSVGLLHVNEHYIQDLANRMLFANYADHRQINLSVFAVFKSGVCGDGPVLANQ